MRNFNLRQKEWTLRRGREMKKRGRSGSRVKELEERIITINKKDIMLTSLFLVEVLRQKLN